MGLHNRMRGVVALCSADLQATSATLKPVRPNFGHDTGKG
jgi:hypothetical protein